MRIRRSLCSFALAGVLLGSSAAAQTPAGSIRGVVYDKDFDAPLPGAQVLAVETGQQVSTSDQGNYLLGEIPPGTYTLVVSKEGYVRQVKADVVVVAGQLSEVDFQLAGEFTEMEEFVVQDILQLGAGSEAALLQLRFESPALLDSISADLMSRAGASDAAGALKLVSGASTQDGKSAVIRGLPDRYVSSQMNGMRLPTADEDKRAVELDQFPSPVIESLRVAKTFTPDQQGDASGGAVDVRTKGIPSQSVFQVKGQYSYNTQVANRSDFLTYEGGGLSFWGKDGGTRDIQYDRIGSSWDGAVGVGRDDAPIDSKWSVTGGTKHALDSGLTLGGFASFFYERDSSYERGFEDQYWVDQPGEGLVPTTSQGAPDPQGLGDYKTSLFDYEQAAQSVQWGGLATLGLETENNALALTYLYTRTAEDKATLATDTRGKAFFFPGYDPNDPMAPGNAPDARQAAPYQRTETLEYTERTTDTLQLSGRHTLPAEGFRVADLLVFGRPELDWTLARSGASLDQPDKRQFGSVWWAPSFNPGVPPFTPPHLDPAVFTGLKPAANVNLGNLQRIWKRIEEDSEQYSLNVKLPFEQWQDERGYLKLGLFSDRVERSFDQDTFSNFGDSSTYEADFSSFWSSVFPFQDHPVIDSLYDVDYEGLQQVSAAYGMADLPLSHEVSVVGGARIESTRISIVNNPEQFALWVPEGATQPQTLDPFEADVDFEQSDVLPAVGLVYEPIDSLTLRASYSQTVARQTFKEITPILQQEFLGGPIFVGNPELQMSALKNYDLRLDYRPYEGGLISLSWFYKAIEDPIEYVQRVASFTYTTAVNYPNGTLQGYELEVRNDLGHFVDGLEGLTLGANATLIDSQVHLPEDEIAEFNLPNLRAPLEQRDMTSAPDYLLNVFLTYDLERSGTQLGLFYTLQGDTLVAGAGQSTGNLIPSVYARAYDTLNLSLSQRLGKLLTLQLQAKNITNPTIEEVYRSEYIAGDTPTSSYTKGIEYSIGLSVSF